LFDEADQVYQKILELQATLRDKQKQLKSRPSGDNVESRYAVEFSNFNADWQLRFERYNEGSEKIEADLRAQQLAKYEEVSHKLTHSLLSSSPTYSVECLNLQRVLKVMVKSKDYKEAHAIQARLNALAEEESEHWLEQQQAKLDIQLSQLKKSQQKELSSLHRRSESGMNELQKRRSEEYETLIEKYQNIEDSMSLRAKQLNSLELSVLGVASTGSTRPTSARTRRTDTSYKGTLIKSARKAY
jgi:hypothetical protein